MHLIVVYCILAILFFIFTPKVFLTLPTRGNKYTIALVHALLFTVVWTILRYFVISTKEGITTTPAATTRPATTLPVAAGLSAITIPISTTRPAVTTRPIANTRPASGANISPLGLAASIPGSFVRTTTAPSVSRKTHITYSPRGQNQTVHPRNTRRPRHRHG